MANIAFYGQPQETDVSLALDVKAENASQPTATPLSYWRHIPYPGIEYLSRQCKAQGALPFTPSNTTLSYGSCVCQYAVKNMFSRPEFVAFYNLILAAGDPSKIYHTPSTNCAIFTESMQAFALFLVLSTNGFSASVFQVSPGLHYQ